MHRITLKLVLVFVGGHLLLGTVYFLTDAIHGVNDMDASFLVLLLFYYLNYPSVYMMESFGGRPEMVHILFAGILQWAALAFVLGAAIHGAFRLKNREISREAKQTTEPANGDDT